MMKVSASVKGVKALDKAIAREVKNFRFVSAVAATRTAYDIRDAQRAARGQAFDNPLKRSVTAGDYVRRADKAQANPQATLGFSDFAAKGTPAVNYLAPHIFGGARRRKRFEKALQAVGVMRSGEFAVPAPGARLNARGNLPRGAYVRALSQLKALNEVGFQGNATGSARSKAKRAREAIFTPRRGGRLKPGVYVRKRRKIAPMLIFTASRPDYSKRYGYFEVAAKAHKQNYLRQWRRAKREFPVRR